MKRLKYILTEETVTKESCHNAILDAAKHKGKRRSVSIVINSIDKYAKQLMEMVLDNTYQPSPYCECHIIDVPSKKHRMLEKPAFFPDQCLHHLMINLIKKKLVHYFDPYCIGNIKGRGPGYGAKVIKRWLVNDRKGTKYCLKCDVKKCYDSIRPWEIMKAMRRVVKDERYLQIIEKTAYSLDRLPLGNYTSSWFSNLILTTLDRAIRSSHKGKYYMRYVDDFIVLGPNKRKLHQLVPSIINVLNSMGLCLKENWQIFPVRVRGIDIIGFRFFGSHTLYRKRNILSMMRSIRRYFKHPIPYNARSVLSRIGQVRHFNSYNLCNKIILDLHMKSIKEMANYDSRGGSRSKKRSRSYKSRKRHINNEVV